MKKHINRRQFLGISANAAIATTVGSTGAFTYGKSLNTHAATTGLVGYWKFDEGSGTTASDASASGYTGALQSGAAWSGGQIGSSALRVTGANNSYVDISQTVVNTAASFSVSAWVKVTAVSGAYQTFVSLDGNQVSAFFLQLRGDTGLFAFTRLSSDAVSASASIAAASVPPVVDVWYHLAGVYDATAQTISLYVNGSLQQTTPYTNGWQGNGHTGIGRGRYGGNPVDFVNGQIDDVRFYNIALSSKAVVDLAAVGYWTFDEGTGLTAADATGNSYNATLQSAATWASGKVGSYALSLTGTNNSYVDIPQAAINTATSFSVTAWVQINSLTGPQTFVSLDGIHVSAFNLKLRDNNAKFAFTRTGSDSTSSPTIAASSSSAATTGTWYHLVGVYDADAQTISLYVNGQLQQTTAYTNDWQGNGHTAIGRAKRGMNTFVEFANGLIDDVHLYNIALDYTAVNTLFGSTPASSSSLTVQVNEAGPSISPLLYGLMFEDISHSGDGGLYAELIRNRILKDNASTPDYWSLVTSNGAAGTIALDTTDPANTVALTTSLKLQITTVASGQRVGVANAGYWGIPVRPNTTYQASFYAKASADFSGPLAISIESNDGSTIYASAKVSAISTTWDQYSITLTTGNVTTLATNRFVISAAHTGTVWFTLVSLFPPTWANHTNGLRPDLMQLLRNTHSKFLRFPGGNYLEGNTLADYFPWKKSLGDLSQRPGHNDPWGYRSTDGLGLLEYLIWCEDLNLSPLLAVYAGYALNGTHVNVGTAAFNQIIQDALDEIEYAMGSTSTPWGAIRAANGHPAPFPIEYVEIGNEDWFDGSGSYNARFAAIFDAIRAAYPSIKLIATAGVTSRVPDIYDQHFYPSPAGMVNNSALYNTYNRSSPRIFVGEYASQEGKPTPDLNSALGDAAFLTGLERNSDVVILSSYAPLFANVNNLSWNTNLIGYDAINSYGSPSYYVMGMFGKYHGDTVVPTHLSGASGLYFVASKEKDNGSLYIKVVNPGSSTKSVQIVLNTGSAVASTGTAIVLSSGSPGDTNTISNPTAIVPVTHALSGLSVSFNYSFAPYSITVLQLSV